MGMINMNEGWDQFRRLYYKLVETISARRFSQAQKTISCKNDGKSETDMGI
jgi:hypothetical protein